MTPTATIYGEDCIDGIQRHLKADSVYLTVTSPPFEELFTYSGKIEDVGNNGSTVDVKAGRFALNLRFVADRILWATVPGCNCCVHIQQLLAYQNHHGFIGRRDFRGAVIDVFRDAGWNFYGETAIAKNPQTMAQRSNLYCLQFKTGWGRTSRDLAPAPNDYVLVFKKPGECEKPVLGLKDRRGRNPKGWFNEEDWIKWANGCWTDIDQMDVLEGWNAARESNEEKHVCPLQLEVIRRFIKLYTDKGELVLDPFMGIGSVAVIAIEQGRNAVGFELKESYLSQANRNAALELKRQERGKLAQTPLFGDLEIAAP